MIKHLKVNKYTKIDETMGAILGLATIGGIAMEVITLLKSERKNSLIIKENIVYLL